MSATSRQGRSVRGLSMIALSARRRRRQRAAAPSTRASLTQHPGTGPVTAALAPLSAEGTDVMRALILALLAGVLPGDAVKRSRAIDDTLSPEEAAGLVVDAIIRKPVRIATRLGVFGAVCHAIAPKVTQGIHW